MAVSFAEPFLKRGDFAADFYSLELYYFSRIFSPGTPN